MIQITLDAEFGEVWTGNVEMCNAATHIAARDSLATEAEILLAFTRRKEFGRHPVAWLHSESRFIFDEAEAEKIRVAGPEFN